MQVYLVLEVEYRRTDRRRRRFRPLVLPHYRFKVWRDPLKLALRADDPQMALLMMSAVNNCFSSGVARNQRDFFSLGSAMQPWQ